MANEGQVAVRFAVKDAEVVRQALAMLGRDGEAALKKFDNAAKPVPKNLTAISDVVGELRARGQGMAGSLGIVGTALLGLGPIGLAAGVALGGVVAAIALVATKSNELADKAGRLVDFAESVNLTVGAVQALQISGAGVGVSAEKVETSIGKATTVMEQFRRAQGEAYDQVNRLNPALAEQLARTRDTAQFVNLLAKAWDAADTSQKNALTRAVFGKGGLDMGRLLGEINTAGGIDKLEKSLSSSIVLTAEQAKKLDELKDAADRLRTSAWDRIWSIGAERALQQQLEVAQHLDLISRKLKEISEIDIKQATLDVLFAIPKLPLNLIRRGARAGYEISGGQIADDFAGRWPGQELPQRTVMPGTPMPRPRPDMPLAPLSAEAEFNRAKALYAVLGSAILPAEQLKLKTLELRAAVASGTTTQEMANRSLDEFKQKQAEAAVATRERLGLASADEVLAMRLQRLDDDRARGYIRNAAEMALAAKLVTKESAEQAKAMEVRLSSTPQLTRLRQDAADLTAQLDGELSGALRGTTSDILAMAKGTETFSEGLAKMTSRLVDAVAQAVLMKTVVGPLANMLTSGLGSMLGGGAIAPSVAGPTGFAIGGAANGAVFDRGLHNFSNGIVDRPTLFAFARGAGLMGEAGPEAIMPLRRDASGRLGVGAMGGGAPININVHNNLGVESSARQETQADGSIDIYLDAVEARSASNVSRGRGPLAKMMPRPPLRG